MYDGRNNLQGEKKTNKLVQEIRRKQRRRRLTRKKHPQLSKQREEIWIFPMNYSLIVDNHLTKIFFIANLSSLDFHDSLTMLMQHFEQIFHFLNETKFNWKSFKFQRRRFWEKREKERLVLCYSLFPVAFNLPWVMFAFFDRPIATRNNK